MRWMGEGKMGRKGNRRWRVRHLGMGGARLLRILGRLGRRRTGSERTLATRALERERERGRGGVESVVGRWKERKR